MSMLQCTCMYMLDSDRRVVTYGTDSVSRSASVTMAPVRGGFAVVLLALLIVIVGADGQSKADAVCVPRECCTDACTIHSFHTQHARTNTPWCLPRSQLNAAILLEVE